MASTIHLRHYARQPSSSTIWPLALEDDSEGGNDPSKDPGEALKNWSSIIGIVTAIVGNVLIALALNVQRYAHTRLNRENARVRRRAQIAMKRAQGQGADRSGDDAITGSGQYGRGGYGAITREGNGFGHSNGHHQDSNDSATMMEEDDYTQETDPLTASYDPGGAGKDTEPQMASTYLKSPYWWAGQILITLGEMGNFLAYGFAPASIVSPLGVVALISNCIIAPVMFKERFRQRDFWGVAIAVGGVVTVVFSAKQEETQLDPHAVWEAITTLAFEIYMAVTVSLIVIFMWASGRYGGQTILIDLGLVGLFGGYTALATKGVSSLLSSTLWRAFTTPVTYVLGAVLLGTAVMQIRYVNKALQRFDSTQVIPVQFVMFTLSVILGSAILYRDFEKTTPEQAGRFVGGCLLTFFGVFLITSGRQHQDSEEDLLEEDLLEEAEGIEENIGLRYQDANGEERGNEQNGTSGSRRSSKASRKAHSSTAAAATSAAALLQGEGEEEAAAAASGLSSAVATPSEREHEPDTSSPHFNAWKDGSMDSLLSSGGQRGALADSFSGGAVVSEPFSRSGLPNPSRAQSSPLAGNDSAAQAPVTPRPGIGSSRSTSHSTFRQNFISPSPLSSTVTTVFKDAFLRAQVRDDPARRSSIRRIRSSIRASLFFDDEDATRLEQSIHGAGGLTSEDNLTRTLRSQEAGQSSPLIDEDDASRRRSRSVSDTIGGLFRIRKKKTNESAVAPNTGDAG